MKQSVGITVHCPYCGTSVSKRVSFCHSCGKPMPPSTNPAPAQIHKRSPLHLDCSACKTTTSMVATTVARFSGVIRVIGGILLVPSFLGIAFAVVIFMSLLATTASTPAHASDAAQAGAALGFGIGFVFCATIAVVSFVFGVAGWIFLLSKKVWKCQRCGFILDRA